MDRCCARASVSRSPQLVTPSLRPACRPRSAPTATPSAPASCCSARARSHCTPPRERLIGATAAEQARQCLENLRAVCKAAGTSLAQAVRLTVYVTDLGEFAAVNEVYGSFFAGEHPPARVTVEVAGLPKGAQVEIDAIVALS